MKLYEYYNISDPALSGCYGDFWQVQTFTPREAHTIKKVALRMYRLGVPGTITVGIRATDVDGLPTGEDLCSGESNGDTLPTAYAGEDREITLGDGAALGEDTRYAIVSRALMGNASNYVRWRWAPTACYSRGQHTLSTAGGVTWEVDDPRDLIFFEYGE